jgi:hypothetical protein
MPLQQARRVDASPPGGSINRRFNVNLEGEDGD